MPVFDNKFKLDVTGNMRVRPNVEILDIKLTPGNAASLTGNASPVMIGGPTRKTDERKLETWKENVKTVRQENSAVCQDSSLMKENNSILQKTATKCLGLSSSGKFKKV